MLTKEEIYEINDKLVNEYINDKRPKYSRCHNLILPYFDDISDPWFEALCKNCHIAKPTLNDFKSISKKDFETLGFHENQVGRVCFKACCYDGVVDISLPFDMIIKFQNTKESFEKFDKVYSRVFGDDNTDNFGTFSDFKKEIETFYNNVIERNKGIGDDLREKFGLKKEN